MRPIGRTLLAAVALAASAAAEGVNAPAADALFDKAVAAMKQGKFDEACPAFAESHRLDPRPGTLFARAECEAKAGKPATASTLFTDYLSAARDLPTGQQTKHKERMQLAEERKKALSAQVAWLTLTLPKGEKAEVTLDGTRLEGPSLGLALPVDPGEHVLVTKSAGGEHEERVTLAKGEKRALTMTVRAGSKPKRTVDDDPEEPVGAASAAPRASAEPPPKPAPRGMKTSTMVAGGVGAAGFVVGIVAGALVFKHRSDVSAHCQGTRCDATGKEAADAARPLATISNVGFAVGVVGVAVALLTSSGDSAPEQKSARVRVEAGPTRGGAGLSVAGAF